MRFRLILILALLEPLSTRVSASSVEERLSVLEKEVERLKVENRMLKESAIVFLSKELEESERLRARIIYREQVVPLVLRLSKDMGADLPTLPKEEEIETMIDAYRPWTEFIARIGSVADSK